MVTISNIPAGRVADVARPPLRQIVVVVPAHNERERLPRCLQSITAATAEIAVPVRVVVVLDGCTDGTEDVIPAGVRAIKISDRNVGAARAAGFGSSATPLDAATPLDTTTWLTTTDADTVVPTRWLARQVLHHRAGAHGMVGTVAVDWQEHSATTQRRYDGLYRLRGRTHGHVHGANLGIRADAYWRVGGFTPLEAGEDVDLVDRLVAAGAPLVWDERNAVLTSDRTDYRTRGGFGDYVRSLAESSNDATERYSA